MFKPMILSLLSLLTVLASSPNAHAVATSAKGVRILLSSANISNLTWTVLDTSSIRVVKAISVKNYSGTPMEIGLAAAGASANTEVRQIVAAQQAVDAGVQSFPLSYSQGVRISVRAMNSAAVFGEFEFNELFN